MAAGDFVFLDIQELKEELLSYLAPEDIMKCILVSRHWHRHFKPYLARPMLRLPSMPLLPFMYEDSAKIRSRYAHVKRYGKNVALLHTFHATTKRLKFVQTYCPNVEEMGFNIVHPGFGFNYPFLESFFAQMKSLQILQLKISFLHFSPALLWSLCQARSLQRLHVTLDNLGSPNHKNYTGAEYLAFIDACLHIPDIHLSGGFTLIDQRPESRPNRGVRGISFPELAPKTVADAIDRVNRPPVLARLFSKIPTLAAPAPLTFNFSTKSAPTLSFAQAEHKPIPLSIPISTQESVIQNLELYNGLMDGSDFMLLCSKCPNVERLTIDRFWFKPGPTWPEIASLIPRLRYLSIRHMDEPPFIPKLSSLIDLSPLLEEFVLYAVAFQKTQHLLDFTTTGAPAAAHTKDTNRLKRIEFSGEVPMSHEVFLALLTQYPGLESLRVGILSQKSVLPDPLVDSDIFEKIWPKVTTLSLTQLDVSQVTLQYDRMGHFFKKLQQLKNLQTLKINIRHLRYMRRSWVPAIAEPEGQIAIEIYNGLANTTTPSHPPPPSNSDCCGTPIDDLFYLPTVKHLWVLRREIDWRESETVNLNYNELAFAIESSPKLSKLSLNPPAKYGVSVYIIKRYPHVVIDQTRFWPME
ncbi:hypothetical protein BGZ94_000348 [Podila epigama]|nr:hypothetical protein BGZ94_000348 [Podila epigama]